jgi:asparagine synthase (glutamine-hydrolysing)
MCGITGILSKHPIDPEVLQVMTQSLAHRGPDAQGIYRSADQHCGLGHRRLSVIDLSAAANQPMLSTDENLSIIFNGEIYNYQSVRKELLLINSSINFKTNSDTETILFAFAQWGPEMVNKLDGMFTIAIYDSNRKTLFLFRDRLGKKPLYYYEDIANFIFASEIKSLLKHPVVAAHKEINAHALHRFLHLGYIPQPETVFTSIKKFPAGKWAVKSLESEIKTNSFWGVDKILKEKTNVPNTAEGARNELREKLHQSVQKRLIADVPVGSFLSGGTDSSLVTAIAAQHHVGQLKTFSIGFNEHKYDESRYAEQVAKRLKTDHHSYILEENEAINILETYLHHFDEPFADTSAIPTMLVSQLTRKEVTVALTGDGGDELFLGYGAYNWATRLNSPLVKAFQNPTSNLLKVFGNDRFKRIGKILETVEVAKRASHIFSQEQYFFSDKEIAALLQNREEYRSFTYDDSANSGLTPAERQAIFDLKYYLRDDLLVKVDRASMYYALECRCPLLDHHVVELALQIPEPLKIRNGERKWILKELLKEFLPDELIHRPKWGFSVPLSSWLNDKLKYLIDDFLNKEVIEHFGFVRWEVVHQLLLKFKSGEHHLYNRIWVLIVMHKWMKENG